MTEEVSQAKIIALLSKTSGSMAKKEILKENNSVLLRKILLYTYDPFRTYGVSYNKRIIEAVGFVPPDPKPLTEGDEVWNLLEQMAIRKITGNDAVEAMVEVLSNYDRHDAHIIGCILDKKQRSYGGRSIGITASGINQVYKNLIPTFDCMLAHKYEEKRVKFPVVVEPKLDGVRVLAYVPSKYKDDVVFYSRSGKEFTTFEHLKPFLAEIFEKAGFTEPHMFDGEVVTGTFNKTVSEVRRTSEQASDAKYFVFDLLPISAFEGEKKGNRKYGTYLERHERLKDVISNEDAESPVKRLPGKVAKTHDQVMTLYSAFRQRGLEGVIVKDPKGLYHRRRNYAWMKIKAEETVDLPIIGAFEGTGKYIGMLGGLIVDNYGVEVRVGGGFDDEERQTLWKKYQEDMMKDTAADLIERELMGRLIEVNYHEITPDGSLRHPRFVRFRDDKMASAGGADW